MKLLPIQFRPSQYSYYSDKSSEALHSDLKKIFSRGALDFKVNFKGHLLGDNEFFATRKYNFLVSDIPYDFAIIYGKMSETSDNGTKVQLTVTQNRTLTFLYIVSIAAGLLCLAASIIRPEKPNWLEVLICGIVLTFIVPVGFAYLGHLNKQLFRNDFVRLLNLKPVKK